MYAVIMESWTVSDDNEESGQPSLVLLYAENETESGYAVFKDRLNAIKLQKEMQGMHPDEVYKVIAV